MDKRKFTALAFSAWLALGATAFAVPTSDDDVPEQKTVATEELDRVGSGPSQSGGRSIHEDDKEKRQSPQSPPQKPAAKPSASENGIEKKNMESDLKKHGDKLRSLEESLSPTNPWTGKLLVASLVVSVLGLGLGVFALVKAGEAKANVKVLSDRVKRLQEAQESLGQHPEYITGEEFDETIGNLRKQIDSLAPTTRQSAAPASEWVSSAPISSVVPTSSSDSDDAWRPFVEAYNSLMQRAKGMQGMEVKNARTGFISQFGVRAFKCVNFQSRVSHPELPPQFADESPVTGSFWAIPIQGDRYAVVPNLKTYEAQIHDTGGMKEAFHSNFIPGKTFNSIMVVRPAIFAAGWTLRELGELRLS